MTINHRTEKDKKKTYQGTMGSVEHRQTRREIELCGAAALTRAQCANQRAIVEAKTKGAMETDVRHEDFPRRRHHGDTNGILQRAGGSRQLPHPRAIQRPQHRHPTVAAIRHEEEIFVGGERQATQFIELARLITSRADSEIPVALHLGRSQR